MCLRPVNHHKFIEVYNAGGSVNANATQLIADCYDGFQIMAHRHSELGARAMMLEIRSRRIVFATNWLSIGERLTLDAAPYFTL